MTTELNNSLELSPPTEAWNALADSDALRIVINLLNAQDKRSLRQTCRAARQSVDVDVETIHLRFEDEDEELQDLLDAVPKHDYSEEEQRDQYDKLFKTSKTAENILPSDGGCWLHATSVCLENCRFPHLTLHFLENAALKWPRLKHLKLVRCSLGSGCHVETVLAQQHFPFLEILEMCGCGLTNNSLAALAALRQYPPLRLRELDLSDNPAITRLENLESAQWPLLDTFTLCRNVNLDVAASVCHSLRRTFPLCEDVDLNGIPLNRESIDALTSVRWPSLTWLTLSGCWLDDAALAGLVPPLSLSSSSSLSSSAAAAAAAGSISTSGGGGDHGRNTEHTTTTTTTTKDNGGSSLVTTCDHLQGWRHIERLDFSSNNFRSAAPIQYLSAAAPFLPNLRSLDLSSNTFLRPTSLLALKGTVWSALEKFEASNMVLVTAAMEGLTGASMPRLKCLTLRNSIMSWSAVDKLACGQWPELRKIDCGGHNGVHLRRAGPSLCSADWPKLRWMVLRDSSSRIKSANRKAYLKLKETWPELIVRCEG